MTFLLNLALQISEWTHFNESELALHVYESVELDIAFFHNRNTASSSDDKKGRPFDYPIHLEVTVILANKDLAKDYIL